MAFLFGIASHMVADVNWHSLGIDQGFLQTMGAVSVHYISSVVLWILILIACLLNKGEKWDCDPWKIYLHAKFYRLIVSQILGLSTSLLLFFYVSVCNEG